MAKTHPRYAEMEFPDWEFHEFPMAVYPGSADGGKTPDRDHRGQPRQQAVIVQNEEERRTVLEIAEAVAPEPAFTPAAKLVSEGGVQRLATEADERADLISQAEVLGVQIDKRWSLARIQDAIDEHRSTVV